ncbi:DUF1842 domain-containing protein [Nitrospirillum iridis]|uniref:DUF1842 domain-containing protein n=1 Tax=Nitrospirillum iridis TaxID=765888 RepID=A0A7X0AXJ1_9PROT|nr:DUF1842 domain-containing protein [Nitrospirillum iridis]MBB6251958.1 hypothetical protein [Nitrospirillum iridis]
MSTAEATTLAGLFRLELISGGAPGAPTDTLTLTVYTPNREVTGHSVVSQAVNPPLHVASHVTGTLIYETVIGPGSKVRIDLNGWPEIHWPKQAGIGPVIPQNYKATLLLEPNYASGIIRYEYRTDLTGPWHVVEQPVHRA